MFIFCVQQARDWEGKGREIFSSTHLCRLGESNTTKFIFVGYGQKAKYIIKKYSVEMHFSLDNTQILKTTFYCLQLHCGLKYIPQVLCNLFSFIEE